MVVELKIVPDQRAKGAGDKSPILPLAVRRDVVLLICIKLAALWAIYQVFFKPYEMPVLQPAEIAAHILDHSDRQ